MRYQLIKKGIKNTIWGAKNLLLRNSDKFLKPKWLWFEVTDRCNSRCTHCHIWQKKPAENPLSPEEIEKVLSDPLFQGLESILNSGGEPVLREDIEEILLKEHKVLPKAQLHLSTNGLLPERVIDVVKTILQHNIPIEIGGSIDGIGKKHDLIRGIEGNFEKVDRLLQRLITMREKYKDKIKLIIGFTLSSLTLDNFEEVKVYAQKMKVDLLVQWYNESSFYNNVKSSLSYNREQKEKMMKIIQSLSPTALNSMWIKWLENKSIKFPCFAMYTFCVLRCNGDIVPCLSHWDTKAGNIRESSPSQIWHSYQAKKLRKIVKNCQGCLNSWGVDWSFASSFYPNLSFNLRHPNVLLKKLI
jgi:MoaA/NifB/PqqE/SkfB family radical SAM enzyme